jgi:hypothetical protein
MTQCRDSLSKSFEETVMTRTKQTLCQKKKKNLSECLTTVAILLRPLYPTIDITLQELHVTQSYLFIGLTQALEK